MNTFLKGIRETQSHLECESATKLNSLFFSCVFTCFYGQNMLVYHVFLGDPPDTTEEGVTSLQMLNFKEKIFCNVSTRVTTAHCKANADGCSVCFCSLSASMNWSWGQTSGTQCLLDFILEFCYLRQIGRNPNMSLLHQEGKFVRSSRQKACIGPH